ncbi:MAG: alanyl-tRNA synthetase [Parcubacteria group bacterium Gr01-1014_106]|nr:MAG: alanyl-tRNA synthetase [Parcubacteria group bacterium Gr01-1014_106]
MVVHMTGAELREKFLEYFRQQGHEIIPSASLIPENDPTVLFTTAGMHPLVPYLLGQPHPAGRRLANAQKCLRTDDIDDVGDDTHLTFFEMLGNWSLGDYFKERTIAMSVEFLTSDRWLGIPTEKLAVTCFAGDADAPRDEESARLWAHHGIAKERIFFFGKKDNWWGPPGDTGPCGPDTEMFFDTGRGSASAHPNDGSGRYVEIWNDVFMEYEKRADGSYAPLAQKNVDTGMGLERTVAVLNGYPSVYETDLLKPLVDVVRAGTHAKDTRHVRIVADHLRAAMFVLADPRGVTPSNVEQGYVIRKLIRRALRALEVLEMPEEIEGVVLRGAVDAVETTHAHVYPEISERKERVLALLHDEHAKYRGVRVRAEHELARRKQQGQTQISGKEAFDLYQSFGFHPDLLRSLGQPLGITTDAEGFEEELRRHQEISRAGSTQRFAGGLADHSERTVKLHTATHLLHAALRRVLGPHVQQRGSNITEERLRFDFTHAAKVTPEELQKVEDLVNEHIRRDLPVTRAVMTPDEAKAAGALGFFEERYGDQVRVYSIGDFSQEICGGPHVERTGTLGHFRIVKEEALAAGIRRIRAVVA